MSQITKINNNKKSNSNIHYLLCYLNQLITFNITTKSQVIELLGDPPTPPLQTF